MAKGCKKCDPHELCEECPEWIFTLADLIMCMMGLFVILWVLKKEGVPPAEGATQAQEMTEREMEVIGEIRSGFGHIPDPSGDKIDQAMIRKKLRQGQVDLEKGVQEKKQEANEGTDPSVTNIRESKLAAVGTRLEFVRAKYTLSADAKKSLDSIAKDIRGTRFIVIIKGHASRDDFAEDANPSKFMDVSIRRAQEVADYLVTNCGISPDILRVQGCSYFEPLQQRAYTRELQQINRRVEVFTTEVTVKELQDPNHKTQEPVK